MIDEIQKMTDSQINEAIATEVMGWNVLVGDYMDWYRKDRRFMQPVDSWNPTQDLNQCWEAEENIKDIGLSIQYVRVLYGFLQNSNRTLIFDFDIFHATARQRCEAMLMAVREGK